jgi:hypothetical protein
MYTDHNTDIHDLICPHISEKAVMKHSMKAYRGRRGVAPLILDSFENCEKRLSALSCLSVCLSVLPHGTTVPTGQISMKFDISYI